LEVVSQSQCEREVPGDKRVAGGQARELPLENPVDASREDRKRRSIVCIVEPLVLAPGKARSGVGYLLPVVKAELQLVTDRAGVEEPRNLEVRLFLRLGGIRVVERVAERVLEPVHVLVHTADRCGG